MTPLQAMLSSQDPEDAAERLAALQSMDARGLIDDPDLQELLQSQAKVTRQLLREKLTSDLKEIR